ncbi:hypothetical protein HPB58_14500 [Priestia filamentosa]|uniref:hypothetical protein n=1 Tax=Priestia filamentosa TaxID=1402861 RepID=UPI001FB27285|nr:hypothetical protein [Priestia filamentosa]MED3728744.1 hypothetical protein [Priestia filamentosa]UOE58549.1 hypothetical protein HPB58_14500 [Priestia filamentosa]
MKILSKFNGNEFSVSSEFNSNYLIPIIKNLLFKAKKDWDDYDEVYHCCHLIEEVKTRKDMNMDFHIMKRDREHLGIALANTGLLDFNIFFKEPIQVKEDIYDILILNYFHICQEGRGNGERWLRDVIIPYYKTKGYRAIYMKSSHPRAFSMYARLGSEIGGYISYSDNKLFKREGKVFKILL